MGVPSGVGGVYDVGELLSEGDMGLVHRAVQRETGLEVAISELPRQPTHDATLRKRFEQEARMLVDLEHPNILSWVDFLEVDNQLYVVVPFAPGTPLSQVIPEGEQVPPDQAASIATEVLLALEHAHAQGLVHGCIRPDSILVREEGEILLAGFGIAALSGGSASVSKRAAPETVWYASPEEIRGQAIDHRSDLYALGVTLYELLAGCLPFPSDSDYEVRKGHVELRPPRLDRPDVSGGLKALVARALQKAPEDRFQSAREFIDALALSQAASSGQSPPGQRGEEGDPAERPSAAPAAKPQPGSPPIKKEAGSEPWRKSNAEFCGACGSSFVPLNPFGLIGREPRCPACAKADFKNLATRGHTGLFSVGCGGYLLGGLLIALLGPVGVALCVTYVIYVRFIRKND